MISPSRNVRRTTVGVALLAAIGLSFVGGMAYQNGIDQPLIGQYAPATTTNAARTRAGFGGAGGGTTSGQAAATTGGAAQP